MLNCYNKISIILLIKKIIVKGILMLQGNSLLAFRSIFSSLNILYKLLCIFMTFNDISISEIKVKFKVVKCDSILKWLFCKRSQFQILYAYYDKISLTKILSKLLPNLKLKQQIASISLLAKNMFDFQIIEIIVLIKAIISLLITFYVRYHFKK